MSASNSKKKFWIQKISKNVLLEQYTLRPY